jgi:hypothetical protein
LNEVIELLEKAEGLMSITGFSESTQQDMVLEARHIIDRAAASIISRMYRRWETPEQYKARTGKAWPDNWAVYWRMRDNENSKWYKWFPMPLEMAEMAIVKTIGEHQLVIATEAGIPPDDWKPEVSEEVICG